MKWLNRAVFILFFLTGSLVLLTIVSFAQNVQRKSEPQLLRKPAVTLPKTKAVPAGVGRPTINQKKTTPVKIKKQL